MEIIEKANKILKDGVALLPDDAKKDFKSAASDLFTYEAIDNALAQLKATDKEEGTEHVWDEKLATLKAYSVQEANRVVTLLWRLQLLPDMLEAAYRSLPTMKEMETEYNGFVDARNERINDIMAAHKVITEEERELDIFKGIINGISPEESEKRYEEYKKQQQAALAGAR